MIHKLIHRNSHYQPELEAYRRVAAKGFSPASIIDVGAFEGNWTRTVRKVWNAPVLMVEPQLSKAAALRQLAHEMHDISLCQYPLSDAAGRTLPFFEMETGSSLKPENSNVARLVTERTTESLDNVAGHLSGPIFLKLDVQGAELDVLRGGEQVLSACELVQLEVALLPYNEGAPTFLETMLFMDARDFVPLDISGFARPNGVDLVQADILFCHKGSSLRPTSFRF